MITDSLDGQFNAEFFCIFVEQLGLATPDYYLYLNQSGCYSVSGTDDQQEFQETVEAMQVIGQ